MWTSSPSTGEEGNTEMNLPHYRAWHSASYGLVPLAEHPTSQRSRDLLAPGLQVFPQAVQARLGPGAAALSGCARPRTLLGSAKSQGFELELAGAFTLKRTFPGKICRICCVTEDHIDFYEFFRNNK